MPDRSANASAGSTGSSPAGDDTIRTLGKYQLLRLLARGGMGEVHLARLPGELGFEKLLVVKTIRADLAADPRFVELFAAEAKTAVALSHPNITPIYELGRADDGTLYTAMGWVDGPSVQVLGERLHELGRKLELGAALFIVGEVLDGLAHAHSHDRDRPPVVHRDITPSNVLVDRSGRVQIVDFGIAASVDAEVRGIMGSAGYMAPEQARGEAVDPRADVFSAGCVLYELLTGERAFGGEGVWMSPSFAELPLREQLQPLLARALALDPIERFADADAFLRAVSPILAEHAPTFASRDLAVILRELFPDDWVTVADRERAPGHAPATKLTGPVQTFATRLRPTTEPDFITAAVPVLPPELENADSGLTESSPNQEPGHDKSGFDGRGRLAMVIVAIAVAAGGVGYLVARADPARSDPATGLPDPAPVEPDARVEPRRSPKPDAIISPVSDTARVDLVVHPSDAEVHVDGRALTGPPFVIELDGHTERELIIIHETHRDQTLTLDPDALPDSPLTISLAPLERGKLSVLAPSVAWAEVWLDGTKLGTTPLTDKLVLEGRHKLEVRCTAAVCGEARKLLERNVRVRPGRLNKFSVDD